MPAKREGHPPPQRPAALAVRPGGERVGQEVPQPAGGAAAVHLRRRQGGHPHGYAHRPLDVPGVPA
ncbi:hypothetical protein NKG94_46445 [Micromonospora sp. M12]